MLIKPFKYEGSIDGDDIQTIRFNTSKGSLNNVRSSIYVKQVLDSESGLMGGQEAHDVVLVSDMIKHYKTLDDYFKDFNLSVDDFSMTTNLRGDLLNGNGINVFGKIVHVFNGIYRGDPEANIKDKLSRMILYPFISYSIGTDDAFCIPVSKVLYVKHGTRTISNVAYYHQNTLNFMNNVPSVSANAAEFEKVITHISMQGAYIDITDPKFPDIHPYNSGEYPRCLEIKSQYTGNELISSLINLTTYFVNNADSLNQEEMENEARNARLRRTLMGATLDDADNPEMMTIEHIMVLRTMARNIAVDYTKVSICSMIENAKVIYDSTDPTKAPKITGLRIPFDKVPKLMMGKLIGTLMSDYTDLLKASIKESARHFSYIANHFRISLYDTPYDILVKITDFDHNLSESVRLNKSEAIRDYLIEGIHQANTNKVEIHRNLELLADNSREN